MKFEFSHPVMASARALSAGEARLCLGMVETPIEIAELSSSDVEPTFEIPSQNRLIVRLGDGLYHPAPVGMDKLASVDLGDFALLIGHADFHMAKITDSIRTEIQAAMKGRAEALYPLPRGAVLKQLSRGENEGVMRWIQASGALSAKRIRDVDEADVSRWRDRVCTFFSNFVLVDGQLFARCHEPIIQATPLGLCVGDYSFYRSHVDFPERGWLGFPAGTGKWQKHVHSFPADMFGEARAFAEERNWTVGNKVTADSIVVRGECLSYATLLDDELVRVASHYATIVDFSITQLERLDKGPPDPELKFAIDHFTDVATEYRNGRATSQDLEDGLAEFASVAGRGKQGDPYQESMSDLYSETTLLLSRRDTLPITVHSVGLCPSATL